MYGEDSKSCSGAADEEIHRKYNGKIGKNICRGVNRDKYLWRGFTKKTGVYKAKILSAHAVKQALTHAHTQ